MPKQLLYGQIKGAKKPKCFKDSLDKFVRTLKFKQDNQVNDATEQLKWRKSIYKIEKL